MDRHAPRSASSAATRPGETTPSGRYQRGGADRTMPWRQSVVVGHQEFAAGMIGMGAVKELLDFDQPVALAVVTIGATTLAADPAVIRTVSPVEPLPGMLPPADVSVLDALGQPVPQRADWHVATVDAHPVAPPDADAALRARYSQVRVSLPSAVTTVHVPVHRLRPIPALIDGAIPHGLCGCVVNAADLPPMILLLDLLAIIRATFESRSAR